MAKLMRAASWGIDTGALDRVPDNRSDGTLSQKAAKGSFGTQKYATRVAAGSSMPQLGNDCIAHILRQGKLAPATTLAVDTQASSLPVNVLEFQEGHFSGTQTQAGEQKQDRVVAPSHCSAAIDLTQQSVYLIGRNPSGNRGH